MASLAAAHPGKMGDTLYVLPTLRYIYGQTGNHFDFYTSDYCEPLRELFEYQPYIDNFYVLENYKIERMDIGVQPWAMPVPQNYNHIYQMGFQSVPDDAIHQWMARQQGIDVALAVHYEHPSTRYLHGLKLPDDYICIAPRGSTTFINTFNGIADAMPSVIIGSKSDYTGHGFDATGLDMLKTVTILSRARGFVGLMSSQLVLANGFPYPKVAPWDGRSWDMRHVIKQASNHYPIDPSVEEVLQLLKG